MNDSKIVTIIFFAVNNIAALYYWKNKDEGPLRKIIWEVRFSPLGVFEAILSPIPLI